MSGISQLDVGGVYYREVDILTPSGPSIRTPVDADSLPTVEIRKGSTIVTDAISLSVVRLSTGLYAITFTVPSTWAIGSSISVFLNVVLSAFAGSPFRAQIDVFTVTISQTGGIGGTPTVNRTALETTFGAANIAQWADVDNDENATTISNRIAWALTMGESYVLGRLSVRYAMPFTVMPALVVQLICDMAGVYLYRSPRGMIEGDVQSNQVISIRDNAMVQIAEIIAGRLKLIDGVKTEPINYPRIITERFHLGIGGSNSDELHELAHLYNEFWQ